MRALTALSVLQTICILVLLINSLRDAGQAPPRQNPHELCTAQTSSPHILNRGEDAALLANEARLRKIISEELARLQIQSSPPQSAASPAIAASSRNDLQDSDLQLHVAQQIEIYRARGSITDQQMHELQAAIAKLDDASRKRMMSRLIRALNSGELNGLL